MQKQQQVFEKESVARDFFLPLCFIDLRPKSISDDMQWIMKEEREKKRSRAQSEWTS